MSGSGAVKDGCHCVGFFSGNGLSLQREPCLNIGEHCRRHRILRCSVDSPVLRSLGKPESPARQTGKQAEPHELRDFSGAGRA
jgi:hypothetical protein